MEDLAPLLAHFLEKHGERLGRPGCVITPEAMEALRRHPWPGNVRELENTIQRALVLGTGHTVGLADLPLALRVAADASPTPSAAISLAEMEREHIVRTLRTAGGNRSAAARLLGVDRKTLYRKLKRYGIPSH